MLQADSPDPLHASGWAIVVPFKGGPDAKSRLASATTGAGAELGVNWRWPSSLTPLKPFKQLPASAWSSS